MPRAKVGTAADRMPSDRDVIPLYHRVYVILLQKIGDGSYPPGVSIPSEDDLAEIFGVSRVTVRKAMDRLEREGRVLRQRGRGTFPLGPPAEAGKQKSQVLKNQLSLASKTKVAVLGYGFVKPQPNVARLFALPEGGELLRILCVRSDASSPIAHAVCYLPSNLAPLVPHSAVSSLPVSAMLIEAGISLAAFEERITAVLADAELSQHLDVEIGTPLVAMTREGRDENGRMVELLQACYRPDRYEYRLGYSIDDQTMVPRWRAMIIDSGAG